MADWIAGALDVGSWSGGCCRGRRGRGIKQAHLPALCLMKAEESEANIKGALMALPGLHIDPLGQVAAITVGGMVRDGWGSADTCHALYVAAPHLDSGGMSIVLTGREDLYPPGFPTVDIDSPGMLGRT
jgi:hypothetical protein